MRKEVFGNSVLYCGDCKDIMPALEKSDLILTDPPYGKVKGDFDDKWTNRNAMLSDCKIWLDLMHENLKFNGTIYWFAWPSLAGRIESIISKKMNPLSHIIWQKPTSVAQKANPDSLRSPMPETERILMAEHYRSDNIARGESDYFSKCDELRGFVFEPIRAYLADEWKRAGLTTKDANIATNSQMAGHYLTSTQWTLPTREKYKHLQEYANRNGDDYLRKDYEDLRKDYEDLRKDYEDLRRPFNLEKGDPKTDIWFFYPEKERYGHPTVKPLKLISFMCRVSSREGDTVLDPFMGSGSTGVACANLGRKFIGIELEPKYFDIACKRIDQAQRQGKLFTPASKPPEQQTLY